MPLTTHQESIVLNRSVAMVGIFPAHGDPGDGQTGFIGAAEPFLGEIHVFAFNFAAHGFALANGQVLSISQNQALFSLLGTEYGGNGTTNFALPNLRGEVSPGTGGDTVIGETGGVSSVTLAQANLPATSGGTSAELFDGPQPFVTTNFFIGSSGQVIQSGFNFAPDGYIPCDGRTLLIEDFPNLWQFLGTTYGGDGQTTFQVPDLRGRIIVGADTTHPLGTAFGTTQHFISLANMPVNMGGSGVPIDNTEPSLALNFIIAVQGVFPSQALATQPFLGEIIAFAGVTPPNGWAFASGQILQINQNQALFSLLGTTYGGNGQTTFALPDLRGRAIEGFGVDPHGVNHILGDVEGQDQSFISSADIPALNITGTAAPETFYGGDAADHLTGGNGNDVLVGNGGDDVLNGGGDNDLFVGGAGVDQIIGGTGSDTVSYLSATHAVSVDLANQWSWDGVSMDFYQSIENAIGSQFNDVLVGDGGANILDGGPGGLDSIYGGAGLDTVSYLTSTHGVSIDLGNQWSWDGITMDFLNSIENAIGSAQNDVIIGDGAANVLDGGPGGLDAIYGGGGSDTVSYASSTHGVSIQLDSQVSWDGVTMDVLNSIENAIGSSQNDVIIGDGGPNVLDGGTGGLDSIYGGGGSDTVSYASSNHGVSVQLDSQVSWDGTTMDFLNSIENAEGSAFDDYLQGSSGDNVLTGGGGNDTIVGGAGNDTIVLSGVLGDYIFTPAGADAYTVTDTVSGRDGTDTFSGIEFVLFGDGTTHPPPDLIV